MVGRVPADLPRGPLRQVQKSKYLQSSASIEFCRLDTIADQAYYSIMRITIELTPDVEKWLNGKVLSGSFASPDAYIQSSVQRDYLEEQLQESMVEPATPLTSEDWSNVRREVAKTTARQK